MVVLRWMANAQGSSTIGTRAETIRRRLSLRLRRLQRTRRTTIAPVKRASVARVRGMYTRMRIDGRTRRSRRKLRLTNRAIHFSGEIAAVSIRVSGGEQDQATARRVSDGRSRRLRLTLTIFETPGSCMVTP